MASVDPLKSDFADLDIQRLRNMVPIHTLPEEAFAALLDALQIESFSKGDLLFREGDTRQLSYYLLEGSVSLLSGNRVVDTVTAGEESARFPIAHVLPRKNRVRADSGARVALLDSRRISELLARTHQVAYEVDDLEEAEPGDWMSLLLQSPVLQQLPASNIQRVMMCVDQAEVAQGEVVIHQGDPGDYFYMLVQGKALVTRDEGDGNLPKELARLGPGSAFGEEALLSDSPRNSTITMDTPGRVLRLAKSDFIELVQTPLSRRIDFDAAVQRVEKGAVWIDLRSPEDYEQDHFPGSVNLPIESLRYQLSSLAPDRHYVLYSNSGGRSAVAAFLLTEQGFDVSLLEGGLNRLREEQPEESLPESAGGEEPGKDTPHDTSELQSRVREAEQRARELEDKLKVAEASVQDVEQQNQQHLVELKGAVDKAREKLHVSEQEKQAALDDVKKTCSEMEALTSNLERLESERSELAERMNQFEGLDKKLQARLEKVERELIGEREKAESASESLEDISQRLNEVMRDRELEREQHARERGELKEEVTCLQLELEQAVSDLEAMRAEQHATASADESLQQRLTDESRRVTELENKLASAQADSGDVLEQVAQKEAELAQLRGQLADAQAHIERLAEEVSRQEAEAREGERQQEQSAGQFEQLERALAEKTTELGELQAGLEVAQAWESRALSAEQQLEEMAGRLANTEATDGEVVSLKQQLQASSEELQQQRQAHEALEREHRQAQEQAEALSARESELAAARAELEEAREWEVRAEQAQQRIEELEQGLAEVSEDTQALARVQQQLDALQADYATQRSEHESLDTEHRNLQSEYQELLGVLEQHRQLVDGLRSDLDQAREAGEQQTLFSEEQQLELEQLRALQEVFEQEKQALTEELAQRQVEVDELRSIMEAYVDQIQVAKDVNQLHDSSERELQKLREDLAAARSELEGMREAARGNLSAAEAEAMRQELHDLSLSLEERQNDVAQAERNRHLLEDTLEDTNAEVGRLQLEVDRLAAAADEAGKRESKAVDALQQSAEEIGRLQQQVRELEKQDLLDERLAPSGRALDVDSVWSGGWLSRIVSVGIGGATAIMVLEVLSFIAGRGELIGSLLN